MKLNGNQITEYIIESLESNPKKWIRNKTTPDGMHDYGYLNGDLGARLYILRGCVAVSADGRISERIFIKIKYRTSKKIYFKFLKHYKKYSTIKILGVRILSMIIGIVNLIEHKMFSKQIAKNKVDFKISKSYKRELRLQKLLGK